MSASNRKYDSLFLSNERYSTQRTSAANNGRDRSGPSNQPCQDNTISSSSTSSSSAGHAEGRNAIKFQNPKIKKPSTMSTNVSCAPHPAPENFTIPKCGRGKDKAVLDRILKQTISISSTDSSSTDSAEEGGVVSIKKYLEKNLKPFKVNAPYYLLINLGKEELIEQKSIVRKNLDNIRGIGKVIENFEMPLLHTIKTIDKLQDTLNFLEKNPGTVVPSTTFASTVGSTSFASTLGPLESTTLNNGENGMVNQPVTAGLITPPDDILDSLVKEFFPEFSNTIEPLPGPIPINLNANVKMSVEGTVWERRNFELVPLEIRAAFSGLYDIRPIKEILIYFLNSQLGKQDAGWVNLDEFCKNNNLEMIKAKTELPKYFLVPPHFPPLLLSGLWTAIKDGVKKSGDKSRKEAKRQK